MTKYKIYYIARDGHKLTFTFMSNRKMIVAAKNRSGSSVDLGLPWLEDMNKAISHYAGNPESSMVKHGGYQQMTMAKNMESGESIMVNNGY